MLLSYCIPCRNRARDLKKALPSVIAAARRSPPVEIVVLDYGSDDDLVYYLESLDSYIVRRVFYSSPYFHMAHARNLSILAAKGEYTTSSNADTLVDPDFFLVVRELAGQGADVIRASHGQWNGCMTFRKEEFIAAGGFDERMEFYGPEDRDLARRFELREVRIATFGPELIANIRTPNSEKVKGYRLPLSKEEMHRRMHEIYRGNTGRKVVNEGVEWGLSH
jgi:glycosyltransferase involved in cell wall biosynthesis